VGWGCAHSAGVVACGAALCWVPKGLAFVALGGGAKGDVFGNRVFAVELGDAGGTECDTGTSSQRRSDGNIELVRFLDSHEGDGARTVSAGFQLLYRNNTPYHNPSKFAHR